MKYVMILTALFFIFSSCTEKDNNNIRLNNEYTIVLGHVCGWCAGADSLFIINQEITYTDINYCDDITIKKQQAINADTWNDLMHLLDLEEFLKISINTCYVCVDGCDTWIRVTNDSLSHMIRFGRRDSLSVKPVQPFIDALNSIQDEFLDE